MYKKRIFDHLIGQLQPGYGAYIPALELLEVKPVLNNYITHYSTSLISITVTKLSGKVLKVMQMVFCLKNKKIAVALCIKAFRFFLDIPFTFSLGIVF